MPLKLLDKCFRGVRTLKKNIFRPKVPKNANFLGQISVFWVRMVSCCPPLPYFEGAELQKT